jgi:hypothetical protein
MKHVDSEVRLAEVLPVLTGYPTMTCHDLDTGDFALEYLIDRILVAKQPALVAGTKKVLKTSMLVDLAISLATGGRFLGYFRVKRSCRVLMMSGESGLGTIQETARRIARAAGKELRSIEGLLWSTALPRFGDPQHLNAVDKLLRKEAIEVLLVDPAYLAMPSIDPGNLFAQGALLRDFSNVCQENGTTLVLAHHTKKTQTKSFEAPELESVAWAGFQEWARQWLLLGRREKYEPGSGIHRLWLSTGGSAGHSGMWAVNVDEGPYDPETPRQWDVEVCSPDEAREERRTEKKNESLEKVQQRVLEAAYRCPDGATLTMLRESVGASSGRAREAVDGLVRRGLLRSEPAKRGKKKCEVYIPVISA